VNNFWIFWRKPATFFNFPEQLAVLKPSNWKHEKVMTQQHTTGCSMRFAVLPAAELER
jgi:hypothetical protein